MAEVMQLTGASREAVRFYINAGLLPEPHRTARNMAWYSQQHIEIIKLVRVLQEEQFLPLKAIKALFDDDKNFDFTPRQRSIFASMREEMGIRARRQLPGPSSHGLAEALGISHDDFRELQEVGAIRTKVDHLTAGEEEILRQFAILRHSGMTNARGFSARHLQIVQASTDLLFAQELKLFKDLLVDLRDDEIPVLMARAIPAINRIFAVLHEQKLRAFVAINARQDAARQANESKAKEKAKAAPRSKPKSNAKSDTKPAAKSNAKSKTAPARRKSAS
ncbi:MAG: MerR family transcriptional regulator [Polycyclovorans sp.]|nr:MerR family transcriptional regulator [Polycyclovorans sp.]